MKPGEQGYYPRSQTCEDLPKNSSAKTSQSSISRPVSPASCSENFTLPLRAFSPAPVQMAKGTASEVWVLRETGGGWSVSANTVYSSNLSRPFKTLPTTSLSHSSRALCSPSARHEVDGGI